MFSVLFPGPGSQSVGMGKELYDNFDYVKNFFDEADDSLNLSLSKLIFESIYSFDNIFFNIRNYSYFLNLNT